ncbi:MAG: UDP-N-acetylglucosamine 2-epimerase (non-hydrolyzing) [Gemmatimonadota bacterium]|nr:UDP-N-acetylglucosamine 2-epimerase (non-hydrolyzing) [Gemmatimonadota bacterium]MDH5760881.1 UDP-N-acetylglucosamine 2-epimerase (non-hydrolyzing) [Gemmatimonadota bacterium]
MPHRVLVVVGTRPEAIKMAPVVHALRRRAPALETRLVLTGQHSTLVDDLLDALGLAPDHTLGIMSQGQSLYDVVHRALDGLRDVVRGFRPDVLLVQGDTATVFAGALVGFFEGVRVGHVEAGLRSGDMAAPFPEEGFRRLTDVLSDYYFAPTGRAAAALRTEGVPEERIHVTGNTVVDALTGFMDADGRASDPVLADVLEGVARGESRLALLTAHRRESFGDAIREVFRAVLDIVGRAPDLQVVYPVHPNPEVSGPAREILAGHPRVHLTEPLGYQDLMRALKAASLVLTDSGGIQEEAPTFGVPVLVLREVTERPEGVEAGVAQLVGTDGTLIVERALDILQRPAAPAERRVNPYGDGRAGERIADIVHADLTGVARSTEDWSGR